MIQKKILRFATINALIVILIIVFVSFKMDSRMNRHKRFCEKLSILENQIVSNIDRIDAIAKLIDFSEGRRGVDRFERCRAINSLGVVSEHNAFCYRENCCSTIRP